MTTDMPSTSTRLCVALDVQDAAEALDIAEALGSSVEWCKVGSHLFTLEGPAVVKRLKDTGKKVFLDLKYHDIPNTVASAVAAAAALGVDMLNVHASGGRAMMEAAAAAARKERPEAPPLVIAVTILTSMDSAVLQEIFGSGVTSVPEVVPRLAALAKDSGLDGVVCSAAEIELVRSRCGQDFRLVVPGIRPAGAALGDQKRAYTPAKAVEDGADFIVVGRPILDAPDRRKAADAILAEMAAARR